MDASIHRCEKVSPKESGHPFKTKAGTITVLTIRIKGPISMANLLFCLEILPNCQAIPFGSAWQCNLCPHQSNLTYSVDCISVWDLEQPPIIPVEYEVKETPKKLGEPARFPKRGELVVTDETLVKTFFEVLSKVRQRYREKRFSFGFNTYRGRH
jgi:hypothetical protein